jgi:predicted RNA-binding Zn ribbon-like protein
VAFAEYAGAAAAVGDGPAAGDERAGDAARFDRALELRAAIDATFRALAAGHDPPPDALDALRGFDAEAIARGRLTKVEAAPVSGGRLTKVEAAAVAGGYDWTWDPADPDRILHAIARSAVDLLRAGPLDRLKQCAVCPWLFLDASRNHSRRWCSMNECGGRDKMRRYRARRRRATAGRPPGTGSPPRTA